MKVLVIGGSGLLGAKLTETLVKKNYMTYATYFKNRIKKENCFRLDIRCKNDVDSILKKISPDVVIHTAAYPNVDECEKNRDKAFNINTQGTVNLVEAASKIKSKFIYISTDYVFDGEKGYYNEENITNPINYYGVTKLSGEKSVIKTCNNFIIARTSVIYGINKRNFATWAIDILERGKKVNIVDQIVSPTFNVDLSGQLVTLIERNASGIFHTAGGTCISRYDFAKVIADVFGLDKSLLNPVNITEMNWRARRPRNSCLDVSKISKFKKPYSIRESLKLFREEIEGQT